MRSGKLRHRLTLQAQPGPDDRADDTHGQVADEWADLRTVWGNVEPLSGRELTNAQQIRHDVTHKITTRHAGRIDPALHRWTWQGRTFAIISALDVDERRRETAYICVETLDGEDS